MRALLDDIAATLATEATFVAEMEALNLGSTGMPIAPGVIKGNRPIASLGQERFPTWVMEAGDLDGAALSPDSDGDGLVVGGHQQTFRVDIPLALVWHQQDPETAYHQRVDLAEQLAQLLLRNDFDGCTNCWLASAKNDRQANHPTHVAVFVIAALVTYTRRSSP